MSKRIAKGSDRGRRELDGADKVTALLLAMGKPQADRIIKQFEDADIRAVARAATVLPEVHLERVEALMAELATAVEAASPLVGSSTGAQELLAGVVTEAMIDDLIGEFSGEPPKGIWSRLSAVPDAKFAAFLASEEAQVSTYVLSKLDVEKTSAILEKLDICLQADLGARLLALKPITNEAQRLIAERLSQELLGAAPEQGESNSHARLGAILNKMERNHVNLILERIASRNPDDARKVRKFIFSFEDIAGLTAQDRARLFDEVPSDRIVLALSNCDRSFVELVLAALSPRSRRIVEAELAANSDPPHKAAIDARRSIAGVALSLAERSLITLASDGQQEQTM